MENIIYFITIALFIIYFFYSIYKKFTTWKIAGKKPTKLKENDKIVLIKKTNYTKLKENIVSFCKLYNTKDSTTEIIIPRLIKVSDNEFIIIFPYNLDFTLYWYFINYMKYPDQSTEPDVIAWMTVDSSDELITRKIANKKVMFYLDPVDKEFDNVFLTTEDNVGYKIDFGSVGIGRPLDFPKKYYIYPTYDIANIKTKAFEDFQ